MMKKLIFLLLISSICVAEQFEAIDIPDGATDLYFNPLDRHIKMSQDFNDTVSSFELGFDFSSSDLPFSGTMELSFNDDEQKTFFEDAYIQYAYEDQRVVELENTVSMLSTRIKCLEDEIKELRELIFSLTSKGNKKIPTNQ